MKNRKLYASLFGKQLPPPKDAVIIWFIQQGSTEATALEYFMFYKSRKWLNNKNLPLKDWKMTAWQWLWNRSGDKVSSIKK